MLESFERGVHSARGDVALQPCLDLFQNRATIGFVMKTDDGEKHGLFERAEHISHNNYIVVLMAHLSTRRSSASVGATNACTDSHRYVVRWYSSSSRQHVARQA